MPARSAITGRYVSTEYAKDHPATTVREKAMTETPLDPPEPPEEELPPKPPIEDMPPEEGVAPVADDEEADVPEEAFLDPEDAAADDSVDDAEAEEQPHDPATLDIAED